MKKKDAQEARKDEGGSHYKKNLCICFRKRYISTRSIKDDKHFPQANSRLEEAVGEDERQK